MRSRTELACFALLAMPLVAAGCAPRDEAPPKDPTVVSGQADARTNPATNGRASTSADRSASGEAGQVGLASWYGKAFAGKPTASGEPFDPRSFTAAHKKLPFGTWVEVRRVDTGRTVRVRINDRGPNGRAAHRIIDLSQRAAEQLDIIRAGVVRVELRVVGGP